MDNWQTLLQYLGSGLTFLVVITILVFVHEVGHFWFAKLFGMKVDSFAVMLGGIRKTDLTPHLPRPMLPSRVVAAGYVAALLMVVLGATMRLTPVYQTGLALIAFVFPVWILSRMGALYHLTRAQVFKPMLITYGVALLMLAIGTQGKAFSNPTQAMHFFVYASWVAMLIVYYQPTGHRPEDAPMGHGMIRVRGEDVPVRFRPVWHTTSKAGTEFSLLALPLGGFAAIHGMHPKPDGSETKVQGGFYSKPPLARLMVLFAGPLFSILLGVVFLFSAFAIYGEARLSNEPVVQSISEGGPAAVAGMKLGDRIVSVNGSPVQKFYDVVVKVRESEGKTLQVTVQRGSAQIPLTVMPKLDADPTPVIGPDMTPTGEMKRQYKLMVGTKREIVPIGAGEAFSRAVRAPLAYAAGLGSLLRAPQSAGESLSGPATLATTTHEATQSGLYSVLFLAGMLSLSLGFMNLLPIPPLDGGQMVIAFVELLRGGRRLSLEVQHSMSTVGMFLVMALMLFVITQDTGRLMGR